MAAETGDVLHLLRMGTAAEHEALERSLDLLDPALTRARLTDVLTRLHGFWLAAESGLDDWARRCPEDAAAADWTRRRRAALFAADLDGLGGPAARSSPPMPQVAGTDEALGRMYVLEGSTLGGTFIDRHVRGLDQLSDVRLHCFSPYGAETGTMWHAFRRTARNRIAAGGDAAAMVRAARTTFGGLAAWCRPDLEELSPSRAPRSVG
jgi:heme oxygenase (biliverdin-IX-beta and delta-forming)